ncbi:MAG: DHA2 family efflux MFS transporter permease subunit [Alphaproteobacteria bacterium]|nr:DHA2 family efflux MFS transporter permease subunit [Alphaproteobacteria bacterium]
MQNLDGTVIATALPTMARAFGADPVAMNVALTSYLLSLAVFIPASGWVADRFGARTVFRAAIFVFTLGSVLCGRADSLAFLVAARVLQGMGGAMMVPVGRLLLLRTVDKRDLVAAMAWLSAPALFGPVLGPPLGGFLVTYASWRWIFDINVPIGLLGIVLVTRFVPDTRETIYARLDALGLLWSGLALASLMFGLEALGHGGLGGPVGPLALVVGAGAAILYALHARNHPAPLLDLALLRIPTFMVSVAGGSLFRIAVGATPFLLPLMLQLGFGLSPVQSGMITFASSAGAIVMKPAATSALRRLGFRDTLLVNGVLSALLLAVCAAFRPGWPLAAIYGVLLFGGLGRSLQFTALNTLAFADIPRGRMSAATSLYSTLQQVFITLGVTTAAATLETTMWLGGRTGPSLTDFSVAFLVVSFAALLGAPVSVLMPRSAGAELSGHKRSASPQA